MSASTAGLTARPVRVAQAAVAILIATKLYLTFAAPPIGDEAYYWMWGQKLGWSYFDHPPLHAWLLHLMGLVFGWNLFSLRVLTWLTLGGTLWIFWLWSRRLKPDDPAAWFRPSAAIYLGSPLFFLMSSVAFHDHLLIFLSIASAHLFLVFAEKWEESGRGVGWLYGAAALLGLAVLTKYNGVLVGIGVAVFFVAHRPLRTAFRSPHLYLAAALSIAIQAPVLWWNVTEGFASYKFHLSERWGGNLFRFTPLNVVEFLALAFVVVSPFLFPAIVAMVRRPLGIPFADRARTLALSVFTVSTLAMLFLSMFVEVFFYWNIVAFLLLMPLLAGWMRRRWVMVLHVAFGGIVALGFAVNTSIVPLGNLVNRYDWTISSIFGWPAVAERVEALAREHDVGFIAATRYTTAAQLGYALRDAEVTAIADRHDQYDFWFDPAAHEGENALIVSDPQLGLRGVEGRFDELTKLETLPFERFGIVIYRPSIYLGVRFHAEKRN
ncbi:MAG: glycosyltransferase family 39 protein [Devosia nanyangense]|uniref:Glycosyltransferase family 39 protein n=1 Tax=Devosia nanyangense TaxID=1228055 RepID=A0A933NWL6_9HYPH|nr:glycosyltransferase family 39 protein [Devosia nanyangense]